MIQKLIIQKKEIVLKRKKKNKRLHLFLTIQEVLVELKAELKNFKKA
jgi:hypothetical protein